MITEAHTQRREIYYEVGLSQQFQSIRECLDFVIHSHPKGVGRAAAAVDMRPSELSEALRGINGRRIDIDMLDPICAELNDWRPLDWWIEKRKENDADRQARQLDALADLVKRLDGALSDPTIKRALALHRAGADSQ